PPTSPLFPYTTLFRSARRAGRRAAGRRHGGLQRGAEGAGPEQGSARRVPGGGAGALEPAAELQSAAARARRAAAAGRHAARPGRSEERRVGKEGKSEP